MERQIDIYFNSNFFHFDDCGIVILKKNDDRD